MPKIPRFCIVCDADVAHDIPDDRFSNPPIGATVFTARGNYGSSLFDPIGSSDGYTEYLECYICDVCLKKKADKAYQIRVRKTTEQMFRSFADQIEEDGQPPQ